MHWKKGSQVRPTIECSTKAGAKLRKAGRGQRIRRCRVLCSHNGPDIYQTDVVRSITWAAGEDCLEWMDYE